MKKILILLLVFSGYAFSEKLILTNNNQQTDITGTASIDITTGDVLVQTTTDKLFADSQQALLAFYPNKYQVDLNDNITINWGVAFASSCSASVSAGNTAGWNGPQSSSDGFYTTNFSVDVLPKTFSLNCVSVSDGSSVMKSFTVVEDTGSVPVAPSVTVLANGSPNNINVLAGTNVNLTWTITDNDLACTFNSTPDVAVWESRTDSGSSTSAVPVTINASTTFSISCTNSDGLSGSDSITIGVSGNPNCAATPPPGGTTERLDAQGNPISYFDEIGALFGFSQSFSSPYTLRVNQYSAFEFNAPSQALNRKEFFEQGRPADGGPAPYTVSISECPGDFTTSLGSRCVSSGTGGTVQVRWSTDPNANALIKCKLVQNQTYYLNVIHAFEPNLGTSLCSPPTGFQGCGVLFTEVLDN